MRRPCSCDRFTLGAAFVVGRDCRLCWLFAHSQKYRDLWSGGTAGPVTPAPDAPLPTPRSTLLCIHLGPVLTVADALRLSLAPGYRWSVCARGYGAERGGTGYVCPCFRHPSGCQGCPDYQSLGDDHSV